MIRRACAVAVCPLRYDRCARLLCVPVPRSGTRSGQPRPFRISGSQAPRGHPGLRRARLVAHAARRLRSRPPALPSRPGGPIDVPKTRGSSSVPTSCLQGQAILRHKTPADTAAAVGASEPLIVLCRSLADATLVVGDTGIEPVTSSVSGKRAPAAPIARGGYRIRTGVNGFAGRCLASRPTHHENAGAGRSRLLGADDGTRTRDPHLGKVMLYQLSHIRVHSTDPYRGAWRWKTITSSRPPRANDSAVIHLTRASFARRHRRWIACPPHRAIGSGVRAPRSHRGGHWFDSSIAHHDAPT